jgi:hypothetical protein
MLSLKDILSQIDEIEKHGPIITRIPVSPHKYHGLWTESGRTIFAAFPYFLEFTPKGRSVRFEEKKPDFEDHDSEFSFEEMVGLDGSVSFGSNKPKNELCSLRYDNGFIKVKYPDGVEVICHQLTKAYDGWKKRDSGIYVPDSHDSSQPQKTCYHYKKVPVYLFTSAYWMCEECKKDLGNLTDDEFKKNLSKVK